ncbi:MAG: ATP-binding protein [Rhizomicrobium sp.]
MTGNTSSGSAGHWSAARKSLDRLGAATARPWSSWAAGTAILIAGVVLVCLAALFVSVNITQLRKSFGWVGHTEEVLLQVEHVREALLQAEASGRAYVLGGGPAALATMQDARGEAASRMQALARLVADNPAQVDRLAVLHPLVATRLDRLARAPVTRPIQTRDPAEAARIAGRVRENEQLMATIRGRFDAMRNAELALLAARQKEADRRATGSIFFAILAGVFALGCGIWGFHLLLRARGEHRIREMRTELMHTQRLALMGQTASMLAHELNQPLAAASNYLAALRRLAMNSAAPMAPRMEDAAQKAHLQIQRAGGIVKRLRSFIDKRDTERSVESPAILIDDAVMLLGTLEEGVELKTLVEPSVPPVLIDRIQLQQVLVNLMRNAIEAMRGSPRRELVLRVLGKPDRMVEISLQDTGPGLPKEIAQRLFQPFVTSKKEGMGVGLSICHGIVTDHGGAIWAEPAPGGGTLFRFTLPTVEEREAA